MGGGQDQVGRRLLYRWRWHHRFPERPGDRWRLHVGGLVPGHHRCGDGQRLRRPDLCDRFSGRLAHPDLPDGRTPAQPRQVHLRRRGRLPLRAHSDPQLCGVGHLGGGAVLSDRTDGRCRCADQVAVRPGLLGGGDPGRRADDDLRVVRRHDRNDLGADHQGRAAADRRDLHGRGDHVAFQLQLRGAVCRRRAGENRGRGQRWRFARGCSKSRLVDAWGRAVSSRTRFRPFPSAWR